MVVNATGCFADKIRLMDDPNKKVSCIYFIVFLKKRRIIPVAGSHIVVP